VKKVGVGLGQSLVFHVPGHRGTVLATENLYPRIGAFIKSDNEIAKICDWRLPYIRKISFIGAVFESVKDAVFRAPWLSLAP
jgi:hypothetical protein